MAEMQWTQPAASSAAVPLLQRLAGRFLDWEDWLTLGLALAAVLSISLSLEEAGWSRDMPALSLVGMLALLLALLLARSPLPALLAWPLAAVAGASVVFWQTLEMVGPGDLGQRLDAIYVRFQTWFHLAFTGGISNDSLPFNVMVVGLTWLGVFLSGWSLYRWHNAWPGLISGGAALFTQMVFVGEAPSIAILLYVLFGFLLLMRTNLMARMRHWRTEGVSYPPLISLSFLHYSVWAVLFLVAAAWIAPVGPFPTPKPVDALVERLEGVGTHFVRLAGPLRVKKITPIHNYTALLPFQGSINLGERELLSVRLGDPSIQGPILLRGAVYDEYASGGWKAGPRQEVELLSLVGEQIRERLREGSLQGRLLPLIVRVEAKSVVGTVLFTPGQPVSAGIAARLDASPGSLLLVPTYVPGGGADLSDEEVLRDWLPGPDSFIGLGVQRDGDGRVVSVQVIDGAATPLPDALVLRPRERLAKGESYRVVGLVQTASSDELRQAGWGYPSWLRQQYLRLPDTLPDRVSQLAQQVAGSEATPYNRAKAIESYLRQYPVDYGVGDTPPGRDTMDYFLFESRRGYFTYHASAMVVMLRAVGVPARLAVGFVIDQEDFDPQSGAYVVRDEDAFAWAEVYIPGYGWVEFNPSPERPADLRTGELAVGNLRLPANLGEIPDLPAGSELPFPLGPSDASSGVSRPSAGGSGPGYGLWIALAAAAFAASVVGSVALGWQRSVAGLPYPQQLWEKMVRLASWAGQPPQPGQTPAEFAHRLERPFRGVRGISALAAAYNRSRFGRREPDGEERELLRRHWPHLRGALLAAIFRRLWRRR